MRDVFDLPLSESRVDARIGCAWSIGGKAEYIAQAINSHDKLVELLKYFYKQPVDLERAWASDHIAKQMDAFALLKELGHEI